MQKTLCFQVHKESVNMVIVELPGPTTQNFHQCSLVVAIREPANYLRQGT